jgi:hypothetical protein
VKEVLTTIKLFSIILNTLKLNLKNYVWSQNIFICEDTSDLWLLFYSNEKKSKNAAFKMSFKKSMREQMAKVKLTDLEKAAKEECLYRNLYAYLEGCVRFKLIFLCF